MQVESIAEQLFFTTLRIDTVDQKGDPGCGTGFFFTFKKGEIDIPFVVTNKHVVHNMQGGTLNLTKGAGNVPLLGQGFSLEIDDWNNAWFDHPDPAVDIAICPFAPYENQLTIDLFYRCISAEMIPTEEQITSLDAIETVTFIGYPNGIWDRKNLIPLARRGTTASPLQVDFEHTPRFLIDASVFGGSSGSPVFIFNQGSFSPKTGGIVLRSQFYFIGVIAAVYFRTQLNQIIAVPIPTQTQPMTMQEEMLDLGVVFKARTVVETIEAFLSAHNFT
jgi:Trypsin-like peptidase domain